MSTYRSERIGNGHTVFDCPVDRSCVPHDPLPHVGLVKIESGQRTELADHYGRVADVEGRQIESFTRFSGSPRSPKYSGQLREVTTCQWCGGPIGSSRSITCECEVDVRTELLNPAVVPGDL